MCFKTSTLEINNDTLKNQIKDAIEGKQSAFNYLLDTFWKDVYGFLIKRTQNENDAEDISIQTFSKAFRKIHTYDSNYKFSTWLITIAKNLHFDFLRKRKTSISSSSTNGDEFKVYKILDNSPSAEDQLINEQNLAKLLKDIKKLKPHYQEVINLRYFQEMSYNEISEELNESLSNVKVKLLRAKKLLADIIQKRT